ncbi:MAG: hypothetical protein AB7I18_12255 [Candidatus Berkiella sp.]
MSQLAYQIRSLISQRTALRDTVGVCDDFTPAQNKRGSIKQHLQQATKESKPLLGNPAHPRLLLDECEQLIIPLCLTNHSAIAVVNFVVDDYKRKAIIEYFDAVQADLSDEHLVSLVAFFTENGYEVEYQCVSENLQKQGVDPHKLISFKAIDLVNAKANVAENLTKELLDYKPQSPINNAPEKRHHWRLWILATMLMSTVIYGGWEYLGFKAQVTGWMALLPANPLLVITSFAAVFWGGYLFVMGLKYLTRSRADALVQAYSATPDWCVLPKEPIPQQRTLFNAFQPKQDVTVQDRDLPLTKKKRSQP